MKIFQTSRGYEALASLPQVSGIPANPPPDDGSGEVFAVWDKVGLQVLVYDKNSSAWSPVGGSAGTLLAANNLSDLTDKAAARTNLGVTGTTAWKDAVEVATTANGTLATAYAAGQTVDGIVLVLGWRILLKNQATGSQNGIYVVTAGTPTRATDMNAGAQFPGAAVVVQQGTVNADTAWICTNLTAPTVDTTAITFAAFGGSSTVHVTGSVTGDGSVGSPLDVRAATESVPGTMSAADKTKLDKTATASFTQTIAGHSIDVPITAGDGLYMLELVATAAAAQSLIFLRCNGGPLTTPRNNNIYNLNGSLSQDTATNGTISWNTGAFNATNIIVLGHIAVRAGTFCGFEMTAFGSDGSSNNQARSGGYHNPAGSVTSLGIAFDVNIQVGSILRATRIAD